ncbi:MULTISPECIES: glycerate kinase [Rhizobium]|uniref:glycerate kinase type-2 family protein n=1 Tax=Rhizobium TaxID=379 RepID=UPI001B33D5BC|nr:MULTISPECIES: glycerate kinase [Rhizobium]MBX4911066.1 glycerate kinase [Rhizobium bangladeshense]MBX5177178.1 glycerate kinase [Rhizobium lentis]MBX5253990.1 glycerate kinase [Rhizobium sp. NLR4b]MBX5260183.1 glycerate kinase [Rhizobium sp. NLR16b]MBX5266273.1 glycerate kinase [Rhizobium sp. NLR16a]
MPPDQRFFLTSLFDAAVAAADPEKAILDFLPQKPKGRTVVVGAGKGAAQLASAFEKNWDAPLEGVVVTRYGYGASCERIKVLEASHPFPDAAGLEASEEILRSVSGLSEDDLVVALMCGGGSALLPAPPSGLTLNDEIALNRALLASGAPIGAMNSIRKHMSRIKGGRLAFAAGPARVVSLVVSDIPGDNPAFVASGPTIPDASTQQDALAAIKRHRIELPVRILNFLRSDAAKAPSPDDNAFSRNTVHVIASARRSLEAAARVADSHGVRAVILSDAMEGEAREAGKFHAALAREIATRSRPFERPVVLLSGGETTVTLFGNGKGGRNTEFLLSAALALDGLDGVQAIAADTDGIDGSEENAGAFADGTTAGRIRAMGEDPDMLLANNDAWTAFAMIDDLFSPGPTGTNVNDFRAILIV